MWLASNDTQKRYEESVRETIQSEDKFNAFKSNGNYNCIVGMSEQWQAPLFYDVIKKNESVYNNLDKLKLNDTIGSPAMWTSDDNQIISPNTLRYINTLCDLTQHFGNLDNMVIAELGIGYGGLAYVVNTQFKLKDYVLCDLPKVQELGQKYLNRFNIASTSDKDKHNKFDLLISEFCLSEFNDAGIYEFYDDLIIKSSRVFLTMNLHEENRKTAFINRISQDFNIKIVDEYPKTKWPNYIIIGTKK